MTRKYFGTDGIRGLVGEPPITPDFVIQLGWALGHYLAGKYPGEDNRILIGKDTRISGYMFESALQAGIVASGVNVSLLGPMPTPAIAYLTRTLNAKAGIVISASHNPYHDNGIKFFSADGTKFSDEDELLIESYLDMPLQTVSSDKLGKVRRINDAAGRYIEYCKSTVPMGFSLKGMRIVLDCAHGATYHIAGNVFKELGAEVVVIGAEPDGLNINEKVGSTEPQALQNKVTEVRADLGIAFDGDGDRVLFVDNKGKIVDGDDLIYIIASGHQAKEDGWQGVVGTVMTNLAIELAIKKRGMQFERAKVGDRYVKEIMQQKGWKLGGEASGHLICGDVTTTGDGIVAALKVLQVLKQSSKSLREALAGVNKFPQHMINVRVEDKSLVLNSEKLIQAVEQSEKEMHGCGRVLLRPSGTEPVIRVMVEGDNAQLVRQQAESLAAVVMEVSDDGNDGN